MVMNRTARSDDRAQDGGTQPAAKTSPKTCVHHWVIETPSGRESHGRCKRCDTVKSFANSTESVMWEQTNTLRNDLRSGSRFSRANEIRLSDEE
jgi:hypothetical protein